ncbi:heme peroxidase family protein [Cocleimonas sp. KMM 6892]|uniref:peroxidase family protein n=1 Tax=unclassified Cocleimonas TaxID=2639732 RepID=UPI002DBFE18A|nr:MULTISPECIES: heme peroxidase family protein [unclassified Cocleimonas]MEB8432107.1 heme peroxidase family protein [Cocleimonas sp. KMM 6892]MEC4714807.1 heme peroxidase family protein [Cocleimonas sp. KMM 6895]MEC4744379.1 heme peroxidase family protein [Cocleimonas sp. KMM 6896]
MSDNHGMHTLDGIDAFCSPFHHRSPGESFGRMFNIAPLSTYPGALKELGKQTGPMDGSTTSNRTNSVAVGDVFFGQFIDHDITLDVMSSLSSNTDVTQLHNARSPSLDLDNIYGDGPEAQPYLYSSQGNFAGIKLLTGADLMNPTPPEAADLMRSVHGRAIIGDPRNDENRVISQLQLAMINFHNHVVDHLSADHAGGELYELSREYSTWHYQWVVVHDFLVKMCGGAVVNDILGSGCKYYKPQFGDAYIPIEFSVAAYRFGHSMIPQKIQIQKNDSALELFGSLLGRGFEPLSDPRGIVDWLELVHSNAGRNVQMAEKLDTKLATDLLKLPFISSDSEQSLATRNLLRGQSFLLPSGENIAHAMQRPQAEIDSVTSNARTVAGNNVDISTGTPLWFYLLSEAETIGRETTAGNFDQGEGLGPVGARIVAETLIGLLESDARSYMTVNRNWEPSDGVNVSTLGEMLTF